MNQKIVKITTSPSKSEQEFIALIHRQTDILDLMTNSLHLSRVKMEQIQTTTVGLLSNHMKRETAQLDEALERLEKLERKLHRQSMAIKIGSLILLLIGFGTCSSKSLLLQRDTKTE